MAGRPRPDHAIMLRRAEEDRIQRHVEAARDRKNATTYAEFEHRTDTYIAKRRAGERMAKAKGRIDEDLDRRRRRLAQLLKDDQEQYEREIEATFETAAERKARMFARGKALREQREAARKKQVADLNFRRLRMGTDDLRTLDSATLLRNTTAERAAQLAEAEEAKRREEEAEAAAALEWEKLRQAKIEREEREARERAEAEAETKAALEEQVVLRKKIEAAEAAKKERDEAEQLARWTAEQRAAAAEAKAKEDAAAAARRKVRVENEEWAKQRATIAKREFDEDLKRLNQTLAREEAERQRELAAAEQRRREAVAYRKRLEEQMAVEKEEMGALDQLYAEEQEREWQKREAQWNAEAAARKALLDDVDASRRAMIAKKEADKVVERSMDGEVAKKIQQAIAEEAAREAEEKAALKAKELAHQRDLFNQIRLREEAARREAQSTYLEGKLMQRAEDEYQRALDGMKRMEMPPANHKRVSAKWYD